MNQNDDFMHYLVDDDESCEQHDCEFLSENDESESEASEDFVSDEEYERMQEQDIDRRLTYAKAVFFTVLSCQGLESICFFSILSNLVIFLNMSPLFWSNNESTSMYFTTIALFFAAVSVSAFVAELYIQPQFIIIWSYLFYLAGACLMTVTGFGQHQLSDMDKVEYHETLVFGMCEKLNKSNVSSFIHGSTGNHCIPLVDVSLVFFALGCGFLKYQLPFFTLQQLGQFGVTAAYFFGWHALVFVLAASFSVVVVTFVQFNLGFFWGYLIGTFCLLLSFLLFALLLPAFDRVELRNTYFADVKEMLVYASSPTAAQRQKQYYVQGQRPSRLSMAMEKYQGPSRENLVREVRVLLRMLPVFCSLVFYWLLSFQTSTSYVIQGVHMRLLDNVPNTNSSSSDWDYLHEGFVFPPTWMFSVSFVTILLFIPLEVYLNKPTSSPRTRTPSLLLEYLRSPTKRVTLGLTCLMTSFIVAGTLEYIRVTDLNECYEAHKDTWKQRCGHMQRIGVTEYYASNLHIAYQIPQFIFMTLGQVFVLTGIFKFAYNESSHDTRGLVMSAFFFVCGLGALFALLCLQGADKLGIYCGAETVDYCNPNWAKMYIYFWVLAGIQFVGIIVFLLAMKTYRNFKKYDRAFPLFGLHKYLEREASQRKDTLN